MGQRVASILAEIGIDSSKFTAGAQGITGGLEKMLGGFGKMIPVAGMVTAAFGILVDQLNKAELAAVEAAKVDAKLEAVLKSTGNAVGMTSAQLDTYATAISKASGMDDELVKNGEAVMLTFTRIGREAFGGAMQAAVDMSAVLGQDLQGSIVQVGKAMNDFSGYTALKRAGVSFTSEQVEQIKHFKETNDLIGYQNLLLQELTTEFGGAAEAINKAGDGAENLKVSLGNLQEAIGEGLIPVKRNLNKLLTEASDGMTNYLETVNDTNAVLAKYGIVNRELVGYIQNGKRVTAEYVNEILRAERANQAWTDRLNAQAQAAGVTVESITLLAEAEDMRAKSMLTITAALQTSEETYTSNYQKLTEQRAILMEQLATATGEKYDEIKGKIAENTAAIEANSDAHVLATNKIKLGYLEQMLGVDGLDARETSFLLNQGVKWGIWTEETVADMERVMEEAGILADNLDQLPTGKTFTYTLYGNMTQSFLVALDATYGLAGGSKVYRMEMGEGAGQGPGGANGMNFIVPPGYPDDSYPVRVQSGEHVQVTPKDQVGQQQGFDYYMMARAFADALAVNGVLSR